MLTRLDFDQFQLAAEAVGAMKERERIIELVEGMGQNPIMQRKLTDGGGYPSSKIMGWNAALDSILNALRK